MEYSVWLCRWTKPSAISRTLSVLVLANYTDGICTLVPFRAPPRNGPRGRCQPEVRSRRAAANDHASSRVGPRRRPVERRVTLEYRERDPLTNPLTVLGRCAAPTPRVRRR